MRSEAYTRLPTALRRLRRAGGLNLVQVSDATGCTVVDVSRAERGENVPDSVLVALCRFYGIDRTTGEPLYPPAAVVSALADLSSFDGPAVLDLPDDS